LIGQLSPGYAHHQAEVGDQAIVGAQNGGAQGVRLLRGGD
jgi:hypothetical protein